MYVKYQNGLYFREWLQIIMKSNIGIFRVWWKKEMMKWHLMASNTYMLLPNVFIMLPRHISSTNYIFRNFIDWHYIYIYCSVSQIKTIISSVKILKIAWKFKVCWANLGNTITTFVSNIGSGWWGSIWRLLSIYL